MQEHNEMNEQKTENNKYIKIQNTIKIFTYEWRNYEKHQKFKRWRKYTKKALIRNNARIVVSKLSLERLKNARGVR